MKDYRVVWCEDCREEISNGITEFESALRLTVKHRDRTGHNDILLLPEEKLLW